MRDDSKIKGWVQLCSDVNWSDHGGMWAHKFDDGEYYVLKFENLREAGGQECADACGGEYSCEVKLVDLFDMKDSQILDALRTCGYERAENGDIVQAHDGDTVAIGPYAQLCIVECCILHGFGAPLETFTASHHPLHVRGKARKYAEEMMRPRSDWRLRERLARQVNAIGTSARDYGAGRIAF